VVSSPSVGAGTSYKVHLDGLPMTQKISQGGSKFALYCIKISYYHKYNHSLPSENKDFAMWYYECLLAENDVDKGGSSTKCLFMMISNKRVIVVFCGEGLLMQWSFLVHSFLTSLLVSSLRHVSSVGHTDPTTPWGPCRACAAMWTVQFSLLLGMMFM
jgi:hypothetical protein